MKSKRLLFVIFLVTCLVQLYVPYEMISAKEEVIRTGKVYKFRTAPIDPNDPFRGKFVRLYFDNDEAYVKNVDDWMYGQKAYGILHEDDSGYVHLDSVFKQLPENAEGYFECKISFVMRDGSNLVGLDFPFDKYYMEESKAKQAENLYRQSRRDSRQGAYALVAVKNGESVLIDVMINGRSIKDIVQEMED